jgi:ABC-type Fe3+-hydroxamate transport system substrate-binding protein
MTPPGSEVVVTLNGATVTVMLKLALLLAGVGVCESVTVTAKFEVPVVPLGVPEITPALLKVRPAGKLPDVRLQP